MEGTEGYGEEYERYRGDRLLSLSIYTLMRIVWRAAWDTAVLPIDEVVQQTSGKTSKVQNGVKSAT